MRLYISDVKLDLGNFVVGGMLSSVGILLSDGYCRQLGYCVRELNIMADGSV